MEKALEIINSNKIYIEIFKNVMKKYKQYSKITGYFNITPKNNEEMDILASFDTNVYNNKKAKIKETGTGFEPLINNIEHWINEKLNEMKS